MQPRITHILLLVCTLLTGLSASSVYAQTIKIPLGQQTREKAIERPTLGMHQSIVETKFGKPISRQEAKGTPPISSWVYEHFVVYFESNHVIHSVIKHQPVPQ